MYFPNHSNTRTLTTHHDDTQDTSQGRMSFKRALLKTLYLLEKPLLPQTAQAAPQLAETRGREAALGLNPVFREILVSQDEEKKKTSIIFLLRSFHTSVVSTRLHGFV